MARAWDDGRKAGRWDREPIPAEEEKRIQKGIDQTMRDVIRDRYNPNSLAPLTLAERVIPQGAAPHKDLPEPLLPGAPTPGPVPWDWIRLGAKPKAEEPEGKV